MNFLGLVRNEDDYVTLYNHLQQCPNDLGSSSKFQTALLENYDIAEEMYGNVFASFVDLAVHPAHIKNSPNRIQVYIVNEKIGFQCRSLFSRINVTFGFKSKSFRYEQINIVEIGIEKEMLEWFSTDLGYLPEISYKHTNHDAKISVYLNFKTKTDQIKFHLFWSSERFPKKGKDVYGGKF